MKFIAKIRNNATGEIRDHPCESESNDLADYIWSDGNYACDCNRALFFERSKGNDDPYIECGSEAYSVQLVDDKGTIIHDEFDE